MSVLAYVMFKVSSGSERSVAKKMVAFDEVLSVDVIFGEYDVVAKVLVNDLAGLEDFLSEQVRNVPNVLVTSTMIISREFKGKNNR